MLDTDAPEVDFVEVPEEYQEVKEVIELIPVGEEPSEGTNFAGSQGKLQSIHTYYFQKLLCPASKYDLFVVVH